VKGKCGNYRVFRWLVEWPCWLYACLHFIPDWCSVAGVYVVNQSV